VLLGSLFEESSPTQSGQSGSNCSGTPESLALATGPSRALNNHVRQLMKRGVTAITEGFQFCFVAFAWKPELRSPGICCIARSR